MCVWEKEVKKIVRKTKKLRIKYLSQNVTKIGAMHTFEVSLCTCVRTCVSVCVCVNDLSVLVAQTKNQ